MLRQIVVGLTAGVVFLVLDGLMNANPLASQVYVAYQPIARTSLDAVAGSSIDLAYGLIFVALFVTLRRCLPGRTNLMKGVSFGAMVWFLRVAMRVAGEWVTTTVPAWPSATARRIVAQATANEHSRIRVSSGETAVSAKRKGVSGQECADHHTERRDLRCRDQG